MGRRLLLVLSLTLAAWTAFFFLSIDQQPLKDPAQYRVAPSIPIVGLNGPRAVAKVAKSPKRAKQGTRITKRQQTSPKQTIRSSDALSTRKVMTPSKKGLTPSQKAAILSANKRKWIKGISGEKVDLEITRQDLSPVDCATVECPERSEDLSLVGVVVETRRLGKTKKELVDGEIEFGDADRMPAVYLK